MDVVKTNIEKIGGTIDMQSTPGQGTTLKIKIPLTLAIIPALIVNAGGDCFAIPQVNLLELVRLEGEQARRGIEMIHGAPIFRLRGSLLPLVNLNRMLNPSTSDSSQEGWQKELKGTDVDFSAIREMHLRWKSRLARLLNGQDEVGVEQLLSPDKCELGTMDEWPRGYASSANAPNSPAWTGCTKRSTPQFKRSSSSTTPAIATRRKEPWHESRASRPRSSPRWPGSSDWRSRAPW